MKKLLLILAVFLVLSLAILVEFLSHQDLILSSIHPIQKNLIRGLSGCLLLVIFYVYGSKAASKEQE
jgi:uncharacterized membrane protein